MFHWGLYRLDCILTIKLVLLILKLFMNREEENYVLSIFSYFYYQHSLQLDQANNYCKLNNIRVDFLELKLRDSFNNLVT